MSRFRLVVVLIIELLTTIKINKMALFNREAPTNLEKWINRIAIIALALWEAIQAIISGWNN